jgi:hypothetical protein
MNGLGADKEKSAPESKHKGMGSDFTWQRIYAKGSIV